MNYESINPNPDKNCSSTINRPDSLNALNAGFYRSDSAFDFLKDEKSVFPVIITGSWEKAL